MGERSFLSTREVARLLDINEKMVYTLVAEKGLPASKVTGKWLFQRHMVERWMEEHVINYPKSGAASSSRNTVVFSGSHDILLERTIGLFNGLYPDYLIAFGNVGSLGGLKALGRGLCDVAASHLMQDDEEEYNFVFASRELGGEVHAVVNFCLREQGLLVPKGNPKDIRTVSDLARPGIRVANRPAGTGTRLLFDRELERAGIEGAGIEGYDREFRSHLDVGMMVLSGRVDVSPAIRPVAALLGLDFISLRWERYDLLVSRDRYFERGVQLFLGLLSEPPFRDMARELEGYDLSLCGKIVFPKDQIK